MFFQVAFRSGTNTRLDDRVFAMCQMKTLPLNILIQFIYPDLYPVYCLDQYVSCGLLLLLVAFFSIMYLTELLSFEHRKKWS